MNKSSAQLLEYLEHRIENYTNFELNSVIPENTKTYAMEKKWAQELFSHIMAQDVEIHRLKFGVERLKYMVGEMKGRFFQNGTFSSALDTIAAAVRHLIFPEEKQGSAHEEKDKAQESTR